MRPYRDIRGGGGIRGFTEGPQLVAVTWSNGKTYRYTHGTAGREHVETMRALARSGEGLTAYIRANQPPYEEDA
jgi:hypothetical protein